MDEDCKFKPEGRLCTRGELSGHLAGRFVLCANGLVGLGLPMFGELFQDAFFFTFYFSRQRRHRV